MNSLIIILLYYATIVQYQEKEMCAKINTAIMFTFDLEMFVLFYLPKCIFDLTVTRQFRTKHSIEWEYILCGTSAQRCAEYVVYYFELLGGIVYFELLI
jgi:hypothetical protein